MVFNNFPKVLQRVFNPPKYRISAARKASLEAMSARLDKEMDPLIKEREALQLKLDVLSDRINSAFQKQNRILFWLNPISVADVYEQQRGFLEDAFRRES